MTNTKPLSDFIAHAVGKGIDVATDPRVHQSVKDTGRALAGVGRALAQAAKRPTEPRH